MADLGAIVESMAAAAAPVERRRRGFPWKILLALIVAAAVAGLWWIGRDDSRPDRSREFVEAPELKKRLTVVSRHYAKLARQKSQTDTK